MCCVYLYTLKIYTEIARQWRFLTNRGNACMCFCSILTRLDMIRNSSALPTHKTKGKYEENKRTLEQSIWIFFQFRAAQWKVFYSWKCCCFESNVQVKIAMNKNGTSSSGFILLILFIATFLSFLLCTLHTTNWMDYFFFFPSYV